MPEIIRTKERVYRDDYSSEDERSSSYRRPSGGYATVQRYRVKPNRTVAVAEVDDDRRSMRSERLDIGTKHHHLEVDRRVERVDQIERPRSALEYRDSDRARETKRTVVYERESDRDRAREPLSPRSWDRDRDVPYERERETDVRVGRRRRERDDEPVEYERLSRETEYYGRPDPPTQSLAIREPPVEKYEMVRREQYSDNREVAAPARRQEEEYYFSRDVRETEPRRDEVARYERREVRPRDSVSDDSDSEVIVRKERRVVRDRGHSPRHRLHIAEGALAGAGAAALLANHKAKSGGGSEHRGRKVAAGAAVGALGAELITRARSQLRERSRNRSYSRSRSRSRSSSRGGNHTKLKTVLAIGATVLAAAAAGKYVSNRNERKEEMARGRSRTRSVSRRRYSDDDDDDDDAPDGKRNTKNRVATIAKAGAGAAIVGGLVEHFRNKSRGRSKSRLRTGGVVAATGLAGAAVAGLYEARKAKQDATDAATRRSSRSRSRARSFVYSDPAVDPELGMVEYGGAPVPTQQRDVYYDPAAEAAERSRERRASRSRSRVRDITSGVLATGAAAIGINQYQKRREEKRAERERKEAERERRHYEEEAPPPEEHYYAQGSYDDGYPPSPPRASGGAYFPEGVDYPPAPVPPAGYTQQTTTQTTHVNDYPPHPAYDPTHQAAYDAAAYHGDGPPHINPYDYPAPREAREGGNVSSKTPFAPQAQPPPPRAVYNTTDEEADIMTPSTSPASSRAASPTPERPHNKSVTFVPLSASSTRALEMTHRRRNSDPSSNRPNTPSRHRRRHRNASRSPSPTSSDEVEVLPDRFDRDGRPLDSSGNGRPKQQDTVERIVHDFEDVIEGRQSWRALLQGFFDEAGGSGRRRR